MPRPARCAGIALDAATLAQLRQRYSGCLCLACLHSLAAGQVPEFSSLSHGCGRSPRGGARAAQRARLLPPFLNRWRR